MCCSTTKSDLSVKGQRVKSDNSIAKCIWSQIFVGDEGTSRGKSARDFDGFQCIYVSKDIYVQFLEVTAVCSKQQVFATSSCTKLYIGALIN